MAPLIKFIEAPNGRQFELPTGLFINNEWGEAANGQVLASINPATEEEIVSVASATADDVDKAVKAARLASETTWAEVNGTQRGRLLNRLADLVEDEKEILATIEAMDNGKPYTQALGDIQETYDVLRYFGGWADKTYGQTIETGTHKFTYTVREPIGVCGQIIPWNYTLAMAAWKLGPCLACGNTSVLKPAEQTPLSVLYFANLIVKAGFPPGVVNIINGCGREAGSALVEHPNVDKIAFTGSTMTAKSIMKSAALTVKNITLEMGSKSPLIVFEDADLKNAVKWAHYGIMGNMGQICTATFSNTAHIAPQPTSRLFVHEAVYDEFVKLFIAYTEKTSAIGDPFDEKSWHGPQVSQAQYEKILSFVESANKDGAKVLMGGKTAANRPGGKGFYFEPTLVGDVTPAMDVFRQEIFGPFGVICKFSSEVDVICAANDTEYGLGAALFTKDITRATRVSRKLQSGMVWINSSNNSDYRVPFGGCKQSGIGRELGEAGLEAYSSVKAIHLNLVMADI